MQNLVTGDAPLVRLFQSTVGVILRDLEQRLAERGWDDVRPTWGFVLGRMELGPTTVNDLAEYLDVSKQAASKTIEHMQARGLVRLAPFPGDGRKKILQYTEHGERFRDDVFGIVAEIEASWVSLIGEEHLATIRESLTTIIHAAQSDTTTPT